jgi:hypothetical protein
LRESPYQAYCASYQHRKERKNENLIFPTTYLYGWILDEGFRVSPYLVSHLEHCADNAHYKESREE